MKDNANPTTNEREFLSKLLIADSLVEPCTTRLSVSDISDSYVGGLKPLFTGVNLF